MYSSNPNQPNSPFAPQAWWKSRQTSGGKNPYGFGLERTAGALALQRNRPGMPTNTVPLPEVNPPFQPLLPADWHRRAQTNTAPLRHAVRLAGLSNPAPGVYTRNGVPISPEDYQRIKSEASALRAAPIQQTQGVTTGATADAYAAKFADPVPPRSRKPSLGGY
jgi:hypothetical protein